MSGTISITKIIITGYSEIATTTVASALVAPSTIQTSAQMNIDPVYAVSSTKQSNAEIYITPVFTAWSTIQLIQDIAETLVPVYAVSSDILTYAETSSASLYLPGYSSIVPANDVSSIAHESESPILPSTRVLPDTNATIMNATGQNDNQQQKDNTAIYAVVGAVGFSGVGSAALFLYRRRTRVLSPSREIEAFTADENMNPLYLGQRASENPLYEASGWKMESI